MRGCQGRTGSCADALTIQPVSIHIRYGISTRGSAPTAGLAFPSFLRGCIRQPFQTTRLTPRARISSRRQHLTISSSNAGPGPLSPEEEAAYQDFMEQRKAERKAWKLEVRRRAKFDPMANPAAPSTSAVQPMQRPAGAAPASAPALKALSRPKVPSAVAPPSRLPNPIVSVTAAAAITADGVGVGAGTAAVNSESAPTAPTIINLSTARNPNQAVANNRSSADMKVESEDDDDEEEEEDGILDLGGLAAMARKVLEDDDEEATAAVVPIPVGNGTRKSKAEAVAVTRAAAAGAAARRPGGAPAPRRQLMPIAQLQRQRAAEAEAVEAEAVDVVPAVSSRGKAAAPSSQKNVAAEAATPGDDDELDWDALQAYEKYEKYVNEVTEEEERAARAAARRAASATATTSTSAGAASSGAPAPAAAAALAPSSDASATSRRRRGGGGAASSVLSDPTDKLNQQLDQWEQLINLFDVVERDSKKEAARKRRLQEKAEEEAAAAAVASNMKSRRKGGKRNRGGAATAPAARAAAATVGGLSLAAGLADLDLSHAGGHDDGGDDYGDGDDDAFEEAELDWKSLERMFLGEGWEAELAELRSKVEAGVAGVNATREEAAEVDESAVESWRDEVSTLLLGLVEISAKRYLGRSLLATHLSPLSPQQEIQQGRLAAATAAGAVQTQAQTQASIAATETTTVGEDERAEVFWEAPLLLLVQDDSADPLLEYANRAALAALRIDSFDEATAGLTAASLVDRTHPRSQQEWLWACTEVAERAERYATIPSLRLRGPGPGAPAVLLYDVNVFRLDSLEEQSIGQVVVARSWRELLPGEEEEKEEQ